MTGTPKSLVEALLVYVEPLAARAHSIVIGDAEGPVADRLLEVGARTVHVFDPDAARAERAAPNAPRGVIVSALTAELDVRDGAFDLAVVPDLALLDDVPSVVARLRRAIATRGSIVAMGRANIAGEELPGTLPFAAELGLGALEYNELYDLFANELEDVSLVGVVPFQGVVFAALGSEDEAPPVSVDTRLAEAEGPSVFVVVASNGRSGNLAGSELDPYAIVQTPPGAELPSEAASANVAAFAAAMLEARRLSLEVDVAREQAAAADGRMIEVAALLERAAAERDSALTRAMELEAVLAASQQTMAALERRVLEAERGCLERDDRIAVLSADLDARHSAGAQLPARAELAQTVEELTSRAERAESVATARENELTHIADDHSFETIAFEVQLAERARVIAELREELTRRERLVKELVVSLEEAREDSSVGPAFEAAAPLSAPPPRRASTDVALDEECARLRRKLDELAAELARREGELTARAWRIQELENERARYTAPRSDAPLDLLRALDELEALRTALAQEHAARVSAESGEELARARSELARQATLLAQMRGRLESA